MKPLTGGLFTLSVRLLSTQHVVSRLDHSSNFGRTLHIAYRLRNRIYVHFSPSWKDSTLPTHTRQRKFITRIGRVHFLGYSQVEC